jgi:hypothetical protein
MTQEAKEINNPEYNKEEMLEMIQQADSAVLLTVHDNGDISTVNGAIWKNNKDTPSPTYQETMMAALGALASMCLETVGPHETVTLLTETLEEFAKEEGMKKGRIAH